MCPSEIVIERPHSTNNFQWCWGVYQPDCHWAPLIEGYADSREHAFSCGQRARERIEYQREMHNEYN